MDALCLFIMLLTPTWLVYTCPHFGLHPSCQACWSHLVPSASSGPAAAQQLSTRFCDKVDCQLHLRRAQTPSISQAMLTQIANALFLPFLPLMAQLS